MNFMANFRKVKGDKLHSTRPPLALSKSAVFHKNEPKKLRPEHAEISKEKVAYDNFLDDEIVLVECEEKLSAHNLTSNMQIDKFV